MEVARAMKELSELKLAEFMVSLFVLPVLSILSIWAYRELRKHY
jgi:hypothetical protein